MEKRKKRNERGERRGEKDPDMAGGGGEKENSGGTGNGAGESKY